MPPGSIVVRDGAKGDLRLTEGSPAIDRVPPLAAVPTDYVSVARPQGSAADIGAYEGTGGVPPITPPIDPPPTGADTTKPQVTLLSPVAGPVSGMVTLDATATDDTGVVGLQYHWMVRILVESSRRRPYKQEWDTSTATPGPHTLTVRVRDAAGLVGHSAPVHVTVGGIPPEPPAGTPLPCVGLQATGGIAIACVRNLRGASAAPGPGVDRLVLVLSAIQRGTGRACHASTP